MFEKYKSQHLEASLDAEKFERQVERKVDQGESGVVGQREAKRVVHARGHYVELNSSLSRNWHGGA